MKTNSKALQQFYNQLADNWDAMQPPDRPIKINAILDKFDEIFSNCKTLLEVGTGTGTLIPIINQRYPHINLTSIDLAENMLRHAKPRCTSSVLVQSDVHILPFGNQTFEGIICHNTFPHFWNKTKALSEFYRILEVNGQLIIFHDGSREKINQIHRSADNKVIRKDLLPKTEDLIKMLAKTGFTPQKTEDNQDRYYIYASSNGTQSRK